MANQITGIDHVLFAARDLDAAAQTFARLGFAVCPRGGHAEWGTSNRCLMFPQDYVELLTAVGEGPGAERVSSHMLKRGEGPMGVALGSRDTARSYESLRSAGLAVAPPLPLSRRLETPEGEVTPRFVVADLPADALPGLPSFLCQHLTPELLRRSGWLDHPNGADGIISLTVLVDNPESLMGDYNRVFGPAASTPTDEMVTVHSGRSLLYLVSPDGFDHLHPELDFALPTAPALVVLSVGVPDLGRTEALLNANGVRARRKGGHLGVSPVDALGIGLEFVQR